VNPLRAFCAATATVLALAPAFAQAPARPPAAASVPPVATVPGMPGVPDPSNLYSETTAGKLSPAVAGHLERVYVPNRSENTVWVIDPATLRVVDRFRVGVHPQHIVPSWDLKVLWVANNAEGRTDGSLTPIDPRTGKPGPSVPVDDPYNMYWSPDGRYAIVVAEAYRRLDFRDAATMRLAYSIETPDCAGINHADFSVDGTHALFTCEFDGGLTKVDLVNRRVVGTIKLSRYFDRPEVLELLQRPGRKPRRMIDPQVPRSTIISGTPMPQDIRVSPDGKRFYVANRGSNRIRGRPRGNGGVSVIDFATEKVVADWPIPGGGSPDMGNVSADGRHLWLSGRYDNEIYRFDTTDGSVVRVKVGREPHGLTVWPQPGRFSLGHTGNLR
jgi:YVTN family beta-propeller protein